MTFQASYDTAANWASSNRVPLVGEWCIEKDTLRAKLGDGATAYNSLPWAAFPPPAGIADGQTVVYDAASGLFLPAAFGSSEIAYADNATGTATLLVNGSGVDLPSCAISVAAQARPVYLSMQCFVSVVGACSGLLQVQILETTSGTPALIGYAPLALVGNTPGATYEGPFGRMMYTRRRLGPTVATRTFKLTAALFLDSGTPTINVINGAAADSRSSYILAEVL